MNRHYYLSLGGNLDPEKNLPAAVELLKTYGKLIAASSVYETLPFGTTDDQPNYLNAAVLIESPLSPLRFQKEAIAIIEDTLGRKRKKDKFAARTIDIDIMLVDETIMTIEHRRIPSKEIIQREFVAIPLSEIAPDYIHPETGKTLAEIANSFKVNPESMVLRSDIRLDR